MRITAAHAVAFLLAVVAIVAACSGGGSQVPSTAIDMDAELDLLHACAIETLERAEYEIELSSDERRTAATTWVVEGTTRTRVTTAVLLHPQMGPAIRAARIADRWFGPVERLDAGLTVLFEPPPEGSGGWLEVQPSDADAAFERSLVEAVQRCWQQRRTDLYESP